MESTIVTGITKSEDLERKMHLNAKVIKASTAGAIVDIGVEQPALLHVSQIDTPGDQPLKNVADILKVEQEIEVWVRNVRKDRIEVSMKKPFDLEWREIEKDMVLKGKIVELEKFGAYVDIGSEKPGLVHISEMTHGYVKASSDVVNVGDEVEVKVLDFNRRKKQVKLSMKALEPGLDEIEGVTVSPARKPKKSKKKTVPQAKKEETSSTVPDPTAMEIALKAAMEKSENGDKNTNVKTRKSKSLNEERENILERTLKTRQ